MLIRSIYDIENDVMIEGPCRTVNKLIGSYGFEKIRNLWKIKMIHYHAPILKIIKVSILEIATCLKMT